MSDSNIELLRRAWADYDRADVDAFAACLADDWRAYGPEGTEGECATLDHERRTVESHRTAFPDKHTEIHLIVADDNLVACHRTVNATHTGAYLDLESTGRKVVVHEMMFNRIEGGLLADTWAMPSGAGFYEQIPGRPAPEELDNVS